MKTLEEKQEERVRKSYEEYVRRHSGQAYKCLTFEQWSRGLSK